MGLMELYKNNSEFKEYVDKTAVAEHQTVDQTLTLRVVAEFAEYLREKGEKKND